MALTSLQVHTKFLQIAVDTELFEKKNVPWIDVRVIL